VDGRGDIFRHLPLHLLAHHGHHTEIIFLLLKYSQQLQNLAHSPSEQPAVELGKSLRKSLAELAEKPECHAELQQLRLQKKKLFKLISQFYTTQSDAESEDEEFSQALAMSEGGFSFSEEEGTISFEGYEDEEFEDSFFDEVFQQLEQECPAANTIDPGESSSSLAVRSLVPNTREVAKLRILFKNFDETVAFLPPIEGR
jgi:hypothetical protein